MKMTTEKRAYERIPLDMEITIFKFNTTYSGTIKNISKNGMYIETDKKPLPSNSKLDLHLTYKAKLKVFSTFKNNSFEVPVQVERLVEGESPFIGMGVMLLNWSRPYWDFLDSINPTN